MGREAPAWRAHLRVVQRPSRQQRLEEAGGQQCQQLAHARDDGGCQLSSAAGRRRVQTQQAGNGSQRGRQLMSQGLRCVHGLSLALPATICVCHLDARRRRLLLLLRRCHCGGLQTAAGCRQQSREAARGPNAPALRSSTRTRVPTRRPTSTARATELQRLTAGNLATRWQPPAAPSSWHRCARKGRRPQYQKRNLTPTHTPAACPSTAPALRGGCQRWQRQGPSRVPGAP